MKKIKLNNGMHVIVDDKDYKKLSKLSWFFLHTGKNVGYAAHACYDPKTQKRWHILMHREILKTPQGFLSDHINGNRLDNRRKNLRICTAMQNMQNKSKSKRNSSGFKGVYASNDPAKKKWRSYLKANNKNIFIGYFSNKKEAAKAYDKISLQYFGEFARLNFPKVSKLNLRCDL